MLTGNLFLEDVLTKVSFYPDYVAFHFNVNFQNSVIELLPAPQQQQKRGL